MSAHACEELVAALRAQAQVKALVEILTGLSRGKDFEAAATYVHKALKHHHCLDVDGHMYASTHHSCIVFAICFDTLSTRRLLAVIKARYDIHI
eukprot:4761409-Pleurochrysis_carterae.AAC.2